MSGPHSLLPLPLLSQSVLPPASSVLRAKKQPTEPFFRSLGLMATPRIFGDMDTPLHGRPTPPPPLHTSTSVSELAAPTEAAALLQGPAITATSVTNGQNGIVGVPLHGATRTSAVKAGRGIRTTHLTAAAAAAAVASVDVGSAIAVLPPKPLKPAATAGDDVEVMGRRALKAVDPKRVQADLAARSDGLVERTSDLPLLGIVRLVCWCDA
jgi:hypothetical protein